MFSTHLFRRSNTPAATAVCYFAVRHMDQHLRDRDPPPLLSCCFCLHVISAGIEQNHGRASWFNFGVLNVRSAVNKAAHIHDIVADLKLDVLALTETWIPSDALDSVKVDMSPPVFGVLHQPRGSFSDRRGGGVALLRRNLIKVRVLDLGCVVAHPIGPLHFYFN